MGEDIKLELFDVMVFVALFTPGFISIKVYDLFIASQYRDFSKSFLDAIVYGIINFACLFWLINILHINNFPTIHPIQYWMGLIFVILIMPCIWPLLLIKIRASRFISKFLLHPASQPWDMVFSGRESFWVSITLKNDDKIAGYYGTNSCASSYPNERQIYLEQEWHIDADGIFLKEVNRSRGVLISSDEIKSIAFKQ